MYSVIQYCRLTALLFFGFFLVSAPALASEKVVDVTQLGHEAVSLTDYFAVFEDPSAALTLADVSKPEFAERFKSGQKPGQALGFSYTRSAIWLRLHLKNPSDRPLERVLDIAYALLAKVDFYQPTDQGFQTIEAGNSRPLSAQALPSRFIALRILIPAGADQQVYLRVQTPNSLNIPASLWTSEAFHSQQPRDYAVQALYFGIVLAIGFYNLMMYFALRDLSYLLYVVFASGVALALAAFTGMGNVFVWGVAPAWSIIGVNVPAALASVAMLLFTRRMLSTEETVPRIDPWIKLFIVANATSFFLLMFWFQEFNPFFVSMNMVTSLLILATGIICARQRQRSAYFFVAAFSVLFLANALTHLRNLGLLPTNVFTRDGMQIGSALEMLLLSLALADRFNKMRREKLDAQTQALRIQGDLLEKLKASEHLLEARVADRTAQLQLVNRQLEALSTTDALTGLANRRHFDTVLANEWARASRLGQPLAIGLLDVDWFKKYNDHYGHQAGDDCLRQVARVLSGTISRPGDLVARYGGEEFVFIALATDLENVTKMAHRVCEALRRAGLPHALSDFAYVTASIGVASTLPGPDDSAEDLLRAADRALYAAKGLGRNQVVSEPAA
jgi:diguanylate cyclase (GGDEF)-like protein